MFTTCSDTTMFETNHIWTAFGDPKNFSSQVLVDVDMKFTDSADSAV